jgi:transcriptional regulator with XRE-family HTH domain
MGRNYPLNIVGPHVGKIRNQKGLSQAALASACQSAGWDISRETIAKIESGFRWVGDFEIVKLARVLQVPITELFPDKEVPFSELPQA